MHTINQLKCIILTSIREIQNNLKKLMRLIVFQVMKTRERTLILMLGLEVVILHIEKLVARIIIMDILIMINKKIILKDNNSTTMIGNQPKIGKIQILKGVLASIFMITLRVLKETKIHTIVKCKRNLGKDNNQRY